MGPGHAFDLGRGASSLGRIDAYLGRIGPYLGTLLRNLGTSPVPKFPSSQVPKFRWQEELPSELAAARRRFPQKPWAPRGERGTLAQRGRGPPALEDRRVRLVAGGAGGAHGPELRRVRRDLRRGEALLPELAAGCAQDGRARGPAARLRRTPREPLPLPAAEVRAAGAAVAGGPGAGGPCCRHARVGYVASAADVSAAATWRAPGRTGTRACRPSFSDYARLGLR